jgi:hypothetical protein
MSGKPPSGLWSLVRIKAERRFFEPSKGESGMMVEGTTKRTCHALPSPLTQRRPHSGSMLVPCFVPESPHRPSGHYQYMPVTHSHSLIGRLLLPVTSYSSPFYRRLSAHPPCSHHRTTAVFRTAPTCSIVGLNWDATDALALAIANRCFSLSLSLASTQV